MKPKNFLKSLSQLPEDKGLKDLVDMHPKELFF